MKALALRIRGGILAAVVFLLAPMASAVMVAVDSDCVGMGVVTWSEKSLQNGTSRLTLEAMAADGFVFQGWSVDDKHVIAWPGDLRYPGSQTVIVATNAVVGAAFVASEDDALSFDISDVFPEEVDCGEDILEVLSVDSSSFPTIKFRNLPSGLSFDDRTLMVFGKPNTPGLYRIEANAVNESGFTFCSSCTMRVRNLEDARVSGIDTEIPVDEYFYSEIGVGDISDIFSFREDPTSVVLSGTVPGLTWSNDWSVIFGTPTEIGEYTLKVTANFPTGRIETASMTLSVLGATPEEYDLDLDVLDGLAVGDELDETTEIGADASDFSIDGVTGLPSGLKASSLYVQGVRRWYVSGQVREPGIFSVTVCVNDRSGATPRIAKIVRTVSVVDVPKVYLKAMSDDPSHGTVFGGGAVYPFEDVTLVAEPQRGFVFAGWHDADGERLVLEEDIDYRTPSVTLPVGTDFLLLSPVAHFTATGDDEAPDLLELEEAEFSFAPDELFETVFSVDSLSLPTLTFKGLPKGIACTATGTGEFILSYDPLTAIAASGRYPVTVTAVNASGRTASATFRVTVETHSDARIHVYDDYGEFTPGEEIDPIDLSGAVDFDCGETLSVSGLPKGLVYNVRANVKKAINAQTITGTPTVPGDYTLNFSAKVVSGVTTNKSGKVTYKYEVAKATAFLTVLPYPELVLEIDDDAAAAGCKLTGMGNYNAGTTISLKATAAKGWVFAGWDGLDDVEGLAALNPKLSYVTGEDDAWAQAYFVPISEDGLTVYEPMLTESGFAAEWPLKEDLGEDDLTLIADLIETVSWPTVKVVGLPSGVKFSASTFLLSGKPTKSGVYHVTVTVKNAGGYSFVRVLDVAVLTADGAIPEEKSLPNAAEVDFAPLWGLTTGVYCPTGTVVLAIGPKPGTGSPVKKVSLSGLPSGLAAAVSLQNDGAKVEMTGTPTKPGRLTVSISVTYEDSKTLKSQNAIVVEDGGSEYLFVTTDDSESGTVSGEGVYAAGATVKLVARPKSKQVFTGWCCRDDVEGLSLFSAIRDRDGIDSRAATVSFPFRAADFADSYELVGTFVPTTDDVASEVVLESDCWKIDPCESATFAFSIDSLSVPKVTVTDLPKGVVVDAVRGLMSYVPSTDTVPGIYSATVSAKNMTQKKATTRTFEIQVANRVSEVIGGLDSDVDAYPLSVGTALDSALIAPTVDVEWKLTAKGLPSGLSFKNGVVTGVPLRAGDYTVTFTATTGKGSNKRTETATITLRVSALPSVLVGTFTGVLLDENDSVAGTVSVTATAAGKISASVRAASNSASFSAKSWEVFTNGVATVVVTGKKGETLSLSIVETDDWQDWQATGSVTMSKEGPSFQFAAQRNSYGTKDGNAEARAMAASMVGTSRIDDWTIKSNSKGTVAIVGKYDGKTVSGSSILQIDDGNIFARYVKFIDKSRVLSFVFNFGGDGRVMSWNVE